MVHNLQKKHFITPVLILGRPNPNVLGQARALGRDNILVCCLVTRGESPWIVKSCCYIDKVIDARKYNDKKIIECIYELYSIYNKKMLLCYGGDYDIGLVARIQKYISSYVQYITDPEIAASLTYKPEQIRRIKKSGITIPKTCVINREASIIENAYKINYPVILRPVESSQNDNFEHKIYIADNVEALIRYVRPLLVSDVTEILIQEYIPGDDDDIYFALAACDNNGYPISIVTGRKLYQYPHGLMCIGETFKDDVLAELSKTAFIALGASGVLGIEFKKNRQSGKYFYIEANLRPDNFIGIAEASGVNLMSIEYEYKVNDIKIVRNNELKYAIWRDYPMLILSKLTGAYPSEKLKNLNINKAESYIDSVWAIDDPFPAFIWYLVKIFRFIKQKIMH